MLHAVIMAGGSGTRFWPASRNVKPKQLLCLTGERSMIQATVDRLGDLVAPDRQRVITNQVLCDPIAEQLPQIPRENIVGEPCKRDTAPCVGLAAALVAAVDPEGTMVVMPSDHVIADHTQFQHAISVAEALIDEDPTRIVTFGIRPSYPAESFGYIEAGTRVDSSANDPKDPLAVSSVKQFREKPNSETAKSYVAAGTFFWNSGIFVWRATTILDALAKYEPEMHERLAKIAGAIGKPQFDATFRAEFAAIVGKSIDYAVMEKYPNVVVIEAPYDWDDVGSWQSLARLHAPDEHGNTVVGNHVGIETRGSIIHSQPGHVIATIDIEDLIIVQTPDATLVAPKHAEERVREVVAALQAKRMTDWL